VNLGAAKLADRVAGAVLGAAIAPFDALRAAIRPPAPVEDVEHLVVVKLWGLGNWALLRPVVLDLRARWPRAGATLVTLEANRALVDGLADDTILLRATGWTRLAADLARAVARLRRARPTLAVDFEQFASAGTLLARAAGVPQRIGFRSGFRARDALLTVRVPFRRDVHASRSFRDLAEAAGVERGPYRPGALRATAAGHAEVAALLADPAGTASGADLVVLHPGSGDNFPGRRWSEAGFAALGRLAAERRGLRVVVSGGASERATCARVAAAVGPAAVVAAGRLSVDGLVALLDRAVALASNDTGPVHIASALGRPVLAFFGPNTPVLYGPLSAGSVALHKALPCSPCLLVETYRSSRCRLPVCMASISAGEAARAFGAVVDAGLSVARRDEVVR
jgi:ADP-heptose:LPS heptosyltransferase